MKKNQDILTLCSSVCEGDGVSPRREKRREINLNIQLDNRRLCRQVQKVVRLVIAELGLNGWDAAEVSQLSGKSVMQVKMVPIDIAESGSGVVILQWLNQHQGVIRAKIADSIHRKQVPVLHFELGEVML